MKEGRIAVIGTSKMDRCIQIPKKNFSNNCQLSSFPEAHTTKLALLPRMAIHVGSRYPFSVLSNRPSAYVLPSEKKKMKRNATIVAQTENTTRPEISRGFSPDTMTIFQFVLTVICLQYRSYAFTWQIIRTNNVKKTRGSYRNAKAQATGIVYAQNTKHSHPMPDGLPCLKQSYYLLRHGQSLANVEGVISSDRSLALSNKHGLTELGHEQGFQSAKKLLDLLEKQRSNDRAYNGERKRFFMYSSPFARARETAEACIEGLASSGELKRLESLNIEVHPGIIIEDGFMERYFGRLDGDKLYTYSYVWPVDSFDVTHKAFNVESVAEVSARVRDAILRIESSDLHRERDGDIVVIVSHADTLQILQAYAAGLPNVGLFSQYRFGNGEVRKLGRSQATLPSPKPLAVPKPGEYAP